MLEKTWKSLIPPTFVCSSLLDRSENLYFHVDGVVGEVELHIVDCILVMSRIIPATQIRDVGVGVESIIGPPHLHSINNNGELFSIPRIHSEHLELDLSLVVSREVCEGLADLGCRRIPCILRTWTLRGADATPVPMTSGLVGVFSSHGPSFSLQGSGLSPALVEPVPGVAGEGSLRGYRRRIQ